MKILNTDGDLWFPAGRPHPAASVFFKNKINDLMFMFYILRIKMRTWSRAILALLNESSLQRLSCWTLFKEQSCWKCEFFLKEYSISTTIARQRNRSSSEILVHPLHQELFIGTDRTPNSYGCHSLNTDKTLLISLTDFNCFRCNYLLNHKYSTILTLWAGAKLITI